MPKKRQPISRRRRKKKAGRPPTPPAPVLVPELTDKQRRFVEEYCADLNATQAAIRAGYSKKSAESIGHENLSKPEIARAITDFQAKVRARAEITVDDLVREMAKLAFMNVADYHRIQENGEPAVDLSGCTRDQLAAVTELEVHTYTDGRGEDARDVKKVRFKLADKRQSIMDLGKLLGIVKDKVEHSGGVKVEAAESEKDAKVRRMSDDKLREVQAHYAAILKITGE